VELTWIAIAASLLMGLGALLVFVFAVRHDYFRDIEDVKYQVFWSDLEESSSFEEKDDGRHSKGQP
jgi:hypothetical protein